MDISVFIDKSRIPDEQSLRLALGERFVLWTQIVEYTRNAYPAVIEEWNYPGAKYGWSFRMKDKKRAILYLLPRDGFFKVAFVFGAKAFGVIMAGGLPDSIKNELAAARVYAEGRGIRIDVHDNSILPDIFQLIGVKLKG